MAIFSQKNKKKAPADSAPKVKTFSPKASLGALRSRKIIISPRITEKASFVAENKNTYVFNIHPDASSRDVSRSIEALYKVTPQDVRTVRIPSKKVTVRGKRGVTSGGKKAYVTLKKGDTIQLS